jgi:hypothetical protein
MSPLALPFREVFFFATTGTLPQDARLPAIGSRNSRGR